MNPHPRLFAGLMFLALIPCAARGGVLASSTFDSGKEGWKVFEQGGDEITPTQIDTGGNPGGFVRARDIVDGNTFYWFAPDKFLGNMSAAFNGTLSYDIRVHGDGGFFNGPADVTLTGGGLVLFYNELTNPVKDAWSSFSITLNGQVDPNWHVGSLTGAAPTEEQFRQVLGALTVLRIRGEYLGSSDADRSDLDNVVLSSPAAVPEPSALALLGVGVAGVLGWRRRALGR